MTIGSKFAARTEDAQNAAAATILVPNPTLFISIVKVARWVTEGFDQWVLRTTTIMSGAQLQ